MRTKWLGPAIAILWIAYLFFLIPYLFVETPAGLFSRHRSVWADWAAHLTFVTHFLKQPMRHWLSEHPLFLGISFNYPFASNLLSVGLVKLGASLTHAMVWPAQFLSILVVGMTFLFYSLRLKSTAKGGIALTVLLTGAATLGFLFFFPDIGKPLREYASIGERGFETGSFLSVLLLPQRALQLGIPMGMLVLTALHYFPELEPIEPSAKRIQIATGVLVGLMPIIHIHTFAMLGITVVVFFFLNRRQWRSFIPFAITAAVATVVVMAYLHRSSFRGGFLTFDPGWLANPSKHKPYGWLMMWWLNWGIFLPLAILCSFRESTRRDPFFWSGAILFVLANFIRFQPWDWDNTKMIFWAYSLMVPSVVDYLLHFFETKELPNQIAVGFILFTMTFAGFLEAYRMGPGNHFQAIVFSREEMTTADALSKLLTPEDVVLVPPYHHDWVSALAGGRILMGFDGWLFSMGIDYHERYRDIREIYSGGKETKELLKKYAITYIVYNDVAKDALKSNKIFFDKQFTKVIGNPTASVYKVTAKAGTF